MALLKTYFARHTWNISRIAFLLLGIMFLINALRDGDWAVGAFGAWLTIMGIMRVGCAAGTCDVKPPK